MNRSNRILKSKVVWMEEAEQKERKKEKRTSVRSLITDFCGYTSAVGPGRIHDGKYIIQKIAWSLLFIGALVAFTIQITDLYKKFKERPLSTHIKITYDTVSSTLTVRNV